jgi:hypothetical protein
MWLIEDRFNLEAVAAMSLKELEEERERWGEECNSLEEELRDAEEAFNFFDDEVDKRGSLKNDD